MPVRYAVPQRRPTLAVRLARRLAAAAWTWDHRRHRVPRVMTRPRPWRQTTQ